MENSAKNHFTGRYDKDLIMMRLGIDQRNYDLCEFQVEKVFKKHPKNNEDYNNYKAMCLQTLSIHCAEFNYNARWPNKRTKYWTRNYLHMIMAT